VTTDDMSPKDSAASATSATAAGEADEASVAQALREHAEVVARGRSALSPERFAALSPEATRDLLHELQVHHIELEMQNEELRRAQVELDASRARYFTLYDLAPVGYCSVSEQGLILQANLAAATLLGATRGTLVKQPISRYILRADQDTWYLRRKLLEETGQAQSLELRLVRQDGTQVWVHVAANAANDTVGPPVILVVLTDVTDRKLMEVAMRESEGHYRALVEWSPEAMLVHLDGTVTYANPAALRLLGARTTAQLEGKPFLDLIDPASHPASHPASYPASYPTLLAGWKKVADPGRAAPSAELRLLRLDGTRVDVEAQSIATVYGGKQVTITSLHVVSGRRRNDGAAATAS